MTAKAVTKNQTFKVKGKAEVDASLDALLTGRSPCLDVMPDSELARLYEVLTRDAREKEEAGIIDDGLMIHLVLVGGEVSRRANLGVVGSPQEVSFLTANEFEGVTG